MIFSAKMQGEKETLLLVAAFQPLDKSNYQLNVKTSTFRHINKILIKLNIFKSPGHCQEFF